MEQAIREQATETQRKLIRLVHSVYEQAGRPPSPPQWTNWQQTLCAMPNAEADYLLDVLVSHVGTGEGDARRCSHPSQFVPVLDEILQPA